MLPCIQTQTDFFQTWYDDRHTKLTFWYQFRLPWLSFTVTVVWEMKNLSVHFLRNFPVDLDEIQYFATTFFKTHAKFIYSCTI